MTRQPFFRSLAAAAVLALAAVPWQLVIGPLLGGQAAAILFALVTPPLYLAAVAPSTRQGARVLMVASVLVAVGLFLGLWVGSAALSLALAAVALAVGRSVVLRRRPVARALVVEVVLLAVGALVARGMLGDPWLGPALALWGFYLVQSFFFVLASEPRPETDGTRLDPFEKARGRLELLLNEDRVV